MINKNHLIFALAVVFSIFVGITCIAAAEVNQQVSDDSLATEVNHSDDSLVDIGHRSIIPHNDDNNDDNIDFTMSAKYVAGTAYTWKVSPETHGADVSAPRYVFDEPRYIVNHTDHRSGGSGTVYFDVHVNSDDYYVKLILVDFSGNIIDEIVRQG